MGIMIRGVCRSCDRTSPIHDTENTWCFRCSNDPEYRAARDTHTVASYIGIVSLFILVLVLMGYCK